MTREIWKPIPGYEGYEASDFGRVRSVGRRVWNSRCDRHDGFWRWFEGRVLKPAAHSKTGHLMVMCGRKRHLSVHVGVMLAFSGLKPHPSYEALHGDGDTSNNVPSNLRWGSRSENNTDVTRHGRRQLTVKQVHEIRGLLDAGVKRIRIAERYGVNRGTITHIAAGHLYRCA